MRNPIPELHCLHTACEKLKCGPQKWKGHYENKKVPMYVPYTVMKMGQCTHALYVPNAYIKVSLYVLYNIEYAEDIQCLGGMSHEEEPSAIHQRFSVNAIDV